MKVYNILLSILMIVVPNCLCAQIMYTGPVVKSTDFKNWSKWIPIVDRNENKVEVSVSFGLVINDWAEMLNKLPWFNYKIINRYNEAISGRLVYTYVGEDGTERQMSCTIYKLEPDEEYFNFLHSHQRVAKVTGFQFVEFSGFKKNSKLMSYKENDVAAFKLYEEIKKQQVQRQNLLNSPNEKDKNNILKDNSDADVTYQGINDEVIKGLLSKVKGWRTNSGLNIRDGIPPQVTINADCQRDQYVNSAVLYSWAAESYYRIKETEKARVAAQKVNELVQVALQLCGNGGLHFQEGSCKTENILPCGNRVNSGISTGLANNSNQPQLVNKSSQSNAITTEKYSAIEKEKELFSGLLPVATAFATSSYEAQATSISDFADKLASYAENDSMSSGFLKVMTRLAAFHVKLEANEITNSYSSFLTDIQRGSAGNSSGSASSYNTAPDFSQMNSFQQKEYVESIVTPLFQLFKASQNEEGRTAKEQKKYEAEEESIKLKNREYREKYGYSIRQVYQAIVNFDYALFEKILDSGFPLNTVLSNHEIYHSISTGYFTATPVMLAAIYGNDFVIKKLIEKGIPIDLGNDLYTTPFGLALFYGRYSTVKLLLESGAKKGNILSKKDYSFGYTYKNFRQKFEKMGYFDILNLIDQYGSDK
jgi:hypothetical protein